MQKKLNFEDCFEEYRSRVNDFLFEQIAKKTPVSKNLNEAMEYGALLGGKRIRPFLVYAIGQMFNVPLQTLDPIAASVECIHAYSLIHDDLPAMDNDTLRRGKPTCHIKYNDATAILAGDALQAMAFDIISKPSSHISSQVQLKMVNLLARASGNIGMCAGQALDIEAENKSIDLTLLETIHRTKTGALIEAAALLGGLSFSKISDKELDLLSSFSKDIGLAFQVQDDILDIVGDTQTLGKIQGADLILHKSTYPSLLGLGSAIKKSEQLYKQALCSLSQLPYNTQILEQFAHYIIKRDK